MLRLLLVLILSALCLGSISSSYEESSKFGFNSKFDYETKSKYDSETERVHTADMDFLLKQKKFFELFFFVNQPVLSDAPFFEIGRNYDIGSNIDFYTDKVIVKDFLLRYKEGKFEHNLLFTPFDREMLDDMVCLYRLFCSAKDFQTFYKTACWARVHVNKYIFMDALYTAILYRTDTKFVRLPAPYEVFPHLYMDSKVIQEAHNIKMTRGGNYHSFDFSMKRGSMDSVDTYLIPSNYSGVCMKPYYDPEYRLSYFFEDIALNSFYYYFRTVFPFWTSNKGEDTSKNFRGEFYYFIHKQLMSRYFLERLSNDLGPMKPFNWYKYNFPGFYSNLMWPNGVAVPKRDEWFGVPPFKTELLQKIDLMENRIYEAIDSGVVNDEDGKQYNIYTPEGINTLGNIIEGNLDTCNFKYYGSYEVMMRNFFDYNTEFTCRDFYVPGSLQTFSVSMRDPMFYRLYNKIVHFFQRYKENLKPYTMNELMCSGINIESVSMDKLVTYMDYHDVNINNAIAVESMKEGKVFNMVVRQPRLNYKPFTFRFAINSDKDTKVMVSIFIGPAYYKEQYDEYTYFKKNYMNFFQIDKFPTKQSVMKEGKIFIACQCKNDI